MKQAQKGRSASASCFGLGGARAAWAAAVIGLLGTSGCGPTDIADSPVLALPASTATGQKTGVASWELYTNDGALTVVGKSAGGQAVSETQVSQPEDAPEDVTELEAV